MTGYMASGIGRAISRFGDGGTMTITRRSSLSSNRSAGLALTVQGTTAAGSASLTVGQVGANGTLLADSTLTIAGDGTTYTVQADAEADNSGDLVLSVSPVLAAEAADGAAITLVSTSTDYPFTRMRDEIATLTDAESLRGDRRRYHIKADGATVEPRVGDKIVDGTKVDTIRKVMPLVPGAENLAFTIIVGDAA